MLTVWFSDHIYISYLLIFVFMTYVYNKVFRTRKLPVLKAAVIYLLLAVGAVLLLFFQLVGLPIIMCLAVAVFLMLLVRVRYFVEKRSGRKSS